MKRKCLLMWGLGGAAGVLFLTSNADSSPTTRNIARNARNTVQTSFTLKADPSVEATSMVANEAEVVHVHRILGPTRTGKDCVVRQEADGTWKVFCERGCDEAMTFARTGVKFSIE